MNWLRTNRKNIVILTLIYTLGIFSMLRADNIQYVDDMGRTMEGYTGFAYDSRYLSEWIVPLVSGSHYLTDVSPLTQILCCLFVAIGGAALIDIVRSCITTKAGSTAKGVNWMALFAVVPLCLNPYFLECLSYKYDSVFMGISVMVCILPFLWRRSNVGFMISSVLCLMIMCTTYQASSGIYPMLAILVCFLTWSSGQKTFRQAFLRLLLAAICYIGTLGFFAAFMMRHLVSYGYINNDIWPASEFIPGVVGNLLHYYRYVIRDFNKLWNIVSILIVLCFLALVIHKSNQNKIKAALLCLLSFACMAVLMFGMYPLFTKPIWYPRGMYGAGVFLTFLGITVVLYLEGSRQSLALQLQNRQISPVDLLSHLPSWIGTVFADLCIFILSWCFFAFSFTYGNALAEQQRYMQFRTEEVISDLSDLPQFQTDSQKKIEIKGSIGFSPVIRHYNSDYYMITRLVRIAFEEGPGWVNYYFYHYYDLPNVKYTSELIPGDVSVSDSPDWEDTFRSEDPAEMDKAIRDAGFTLEQESSYHRIWNKGDDYIVELKDCTSPDEQNQD